MCSSRDSTAGSEAAEGEDGEGERRKQRKPKANRAARSRVMGFVRRIVRAPAIMAGSTALTGRSMWPVGGCKNEMFFFPFFLDGPFLFVMYVVNQGDRRCCQGIKGNDVLLVRDQWIHEPACGQHHITGRDRKWVKRRSIRSKLVAEGHRGKYSEVRVSSEGAGGEMTMNSR